MQKEDTDSTQTDKTEQNTVTATGESEKYTEIYTLSFIPMHAAQTDLSHQLFWQQRSISSSTLQGRPVPLSL